MGLLEVSQPDRQKTTLASLMTGKLCDVPVQPLSRSVPWPRTVNVIWSGPPALFLPHVRPPPPVPQLPALLFLFLRQARTSVSLSGFPDVFAVSLNFMLFFSATVTSTDEPQR